MNQAGRASGDGSEVKAALASSEPPWAPASLGLHDVAASFLVSVGPLHPQAARRLGPWKCRDSSCLQLRGTTPPSSCSTDSQLAPKKLMAWESLWLA